MLLRLQGTRLQSNSIVDGVAESLFAAQVAFRGLYRNVPQQKLNLLQLPASLMAQTGACPAQVVRRERRNITVPCFLFHDAPDDLGAESGPPNPASLVDRTKKRPGRNPGGRHPGVDSSFHPGRDRNGSYMTALADKIGYDPVLLSLLYVFNAQRSQFRPT